MKAMDELLKRGLVNGGGEHPLIPFDPYKNQETLKGGEWPMTIHGRLGASSLYAGPDPYDGNFSYPDDPLGGGGFGPDFSRETPSTRYMDEAPLGEIPDISLAPGSLMEKAKSLFTGKWRVPILIAGFLGTLYLIRNREALLEKLGFRD